MAGGQRRSTKVLVFSAIMSALGVVMLSLGSVIEVLDLTMAQVASLLTFIVLLEAGSYWPWLVYAVTGTLAMLLLPNKFPALIYVAFSGFYPMIKVLIEKQKTKLGGMLTWILKAVAFNICLTVIIFVGKMLLGTEALGFDFSWLVYLLANVLFILYDFVLSRLVVLYVHVWRKKFNINLK